MIKGLELARKKGVKEHDRGGWFNQFEHNVRMEEKVEKREEFELFKKLEVFKNEGDE